MASDTVVITICWVIWKERNNRIFRSTEAGSINEIVKTISFLADDWTKLSKIKHLREELYILGNQERPTE